MLVNTNAIVISALKYGEADLIVKCFTQKSGLKSYLLRGILKSKKGKFKTSMFQPLSQLELVAKHKDKGTLEYLQEAKMLSTYRTLHTDVVKSAMVLFISEILRNSIQEEEENEALYHYLETTLNWLDHHEKFANFHLLFMLKLTRYLGFYPDDSNTDPDYFNMLDGVFQDVETNNYCIEGQNSLVLKQLLGINFDELELLKLTKTNRTHFLEMLLLYYQLHIDAFKKPKSLAVLHEIFN
ncbi:DNA repair protein RecO [Gillisia limnaea]|uniref:DNA repair protein RecO n=1 Tax=Gillisia limnaea (strain DSM 15749 / LMG 21470 / R-8282) TaxID=865937 RepID=H2BUY8_GILLR|nr:DNA repair protein RecO [Gillisia limnaea]EHQ02836.1 DNA replication and repair protein RecO [Gillisia limnaea DSM 15749]